MLSEISTQSLEAAFFNYLSCVMINQLIQSSVMTRTRSWSCLAQCIVYQALWNVPPKYVLVSFTVCGSPLINKLLNALPSDAFSSLSVFIASIKRYSLRCIVRKICRYAALLLRSPDIWWILFPKRFRIMTNISILRSVINSQAWYLQKCWFCYFPMLTIRPRWAKTSRKWHFTFR